MRIEFGSEWDSNITRKKAVVTFFKVTFLYKSVTGSYSSSIWLFNFYINIFY